MARKGGPRRCKSAASKITICFRSRYQFRSATQPAGPPGVCRVGLCGSGHIARMGDEAKLMPSTRPVQAGRVFSCPDAASGWPARAIPVALSLQPGVSQNHSAVTPRNILAKVTAMSLPDSDDKPQQSSRHRAARKVTAPASFRCRAPGLPASVLTSDRTNFSGASMAVPPGRMTGR